MALSPKDVTAVTVTYGNRKHLLERAIRAARSEGIGQLVVVDNGALWPVSAELEEGGFEDRLDIIEMGRNTGSAGGYAAGLSRALELGAEYIWLLDDDNHPEQGCLGTLLSAYRRLRTDHNADRLAVLAFRPEHQADVAVGVPLHRITPRPNAFRGFHVLDIPYKLWRRTPWGRPRLTSGLPNSLDLDVAPYSGLLFHRALIECVGLPRRDFVLYGDDHEFSGRIAQSGGCISLIPGARLMDMEASWNVPESPATSFAVLLGQGSDFRAYYSTRNSTFLETHCRSNDPLMLRLNRWVYLVALGVVAALSGRLRRYRLVLQAVGDGLAARLGINPRFPLA
jgi:GT2 family glycosyltransferase